MLNLNHKENIDMVKKLNTINNNEFKLPFIPIKYAYREISNNYMFKRYYIVFRCVTSKSYTSKKI